MIVVDRTLTFRVKGEINEPFKKEFTAAKYVAIVVDTYTEITQNHCEDQYTLTKINVTKQGVVGSGSGSGFT